MRIAFFADYLNHHQLPFCLAMDRLTGGQFTFVATTSVSENRIKLGYQDMNKQYPFVLTTYDSDENQQQAMKLAKDCDVFILGSAPKEYLQERLKYKKLSFVYSERLYKSGYEAWKWPVRLIKQYKAYGRHRNLYLLCAGAFTAADFAKTGTFVHKAYQWGYFPQFKRQEVNALLAQKAEDKQISMLWVGRLIPWKRPEDALALAEKLKVNGYAFRLDMVGTGDMDTQLQTIITQKGLSNHVHLMGAMTPEQVRERMEKADIYLFTSDRNEGWGAVLNESMNSGCAVVASHAIGAVPFLLNDGQNGLVYRGGDGDDLYAKVKYLMDHPDERRRLGEKAYLTLENAWNAESAAQRLLLLAQDLMEHKRSTRFADGPCSPAKNVKDTWYETKKSVF